MSTQNIQIVVSESGVRVVKSRLTELGGAAKNAGASVDKSIAGLQRFNNVSLDRVNNQVARFDSNISRTVHKIRGMMTIMAALAGTTISTGSIIKAMDSYTNLQNKLRIVSDSQSQLNKLTEEMFRISNITRMEVETTATSFQRFDLALKSVGRSQQETLDITETINKMLAMSGKGAQESAAALLQLSQAFSKGKLDGDEFRTVSETMPLLMDALAKQFNTTRGGLLELRSEGKITLDVLIAALQNAKPEVDKTFGGIQTTVSGAVTIMKNNWVKFWGELDKNVSISPKIASLIVWLSEHFKVMAAVGVAGITAIAVTLSSRLLPALTSVFAAMMANPIAALSTATIAAIAGIIAYVVLFEDELRASKGVAADAGVFILDMLDAIWAGFENLYGVAVTVLEGITGKTLQETNNQTSIFQSFFGTTNQGFWGMMEFIAKSWDMMATSLAAACSYVVKFIGTAFSNLFTWLGNKVKSFANSVIPLINAAADFVGLSSPLEGVSFVMGDYDEAPTWMNEVLSNYKTAAADMVRAAADNRKAARELRDAQKVTGDGLVLRSQNEKLMKQVADASNSGKAGKAAKGAAGSSSKSETEKYNKQFYRKNLNIKAGAEAGELTQTGVYAAAYALKKMFGENIIRYGAFNDKLHLGKNSTHNSGLAFDATPKHNLSQLSKQVIASQFSSWMNEMGFDANVKYEHAGKKNANGTTSTADHIHFNFKSVAEAQRFEKFLAAQLGGGGVEKRSDFVSTAEDQAKAAIKAAESYSKVTTKLQEETAALNVVNPLRASEQKFLESIKDLKQQDADITQNQIEELKQLALAYEKAYGDKFLYEIAEAHKEELNSLKFVTTEEKAIYEIRKKVNDERKNGLFLTESEISKLEEEAVQHAKILQIEQAKLDVHRSQVTELEKLKSERQAILEMMGSGEIGGAYANRKLTENNTAIGRANQGMGLAADGSSMANSVQGVFSAMRLGEDQLLEGYTGTLNDLTDQFGTFFTNIQDGFADSIGKAIVYGGSLKDALVDVSQQGLASLISGLVKLAAQWALNAALGNSIAATAGATQAAMSAALAASVATAWATPAALVSLASFGANSAAATAGIGATIGYSEMMAATSIIPGFQGGGYTGAAGVSEIAGVVHGQEYVFDADATRRIGVHNLEALRSGNISTNRGGEISTSTSGNGITVNIQNMASGVTHEVEQISENEIRIIAREEAKQAVRREAPGVISAEISNPNSNVSKSLARNTQTQRRRA